MSKRKWLLWTFILVLALLAAASAGMSRVLRANSVRRYLIGYLETSFGRTVDVDRFDFSILNGGRLEAHAVSVSEDPRFGHEYFLRAETLTASPRWSALVAGRFELGTLVLSRSSLNLVRDAQGRWNIELWLPPAAPIPYSGIPVGAAAAAHGAPTARLSRIDIDGGRINFKQGDAKSVFALLDVSGRMEQDSNGRWDLDVKARPMRVGVQLQDIGTLRLRGNISGTSARLQPAELNLTWRQVSVADVLRLSRQVDYGIRGQLDIDVTARVASVDVNDPAAAHSATSDAPDKAHTTVAAPKAERTVVPVAQWTISGTGRLTGMHGWAFAGRSTDPAVVASAEARWNAGEPRAEIGKLIVEMPGSHLQGIGALAWGHGFAPQLSFESSTVALSDALSWYRAFRAGVSDELAVEGTLGLDASLGGWPLRLQQAVVVGSGARLTAPSLALPLQVGPIGAKASESGVEFAATEISFAVPSPVALPPTSRSGEPRAAPQLANEKLAADKFALGGKLLPVERGTFHWASDWNATVEGTTSHVQNWLALLDSIGQARNAGWTAQGGLALNLRGSHKQGAPATLWAGTMDLRDFSLNPAYVNQPLLLRKAHVDFTPAQRTVTLLEAEAFGATWRGSLSRKSGEAAWMFDVAADRLDAAELDRWLGPRARTGLLARIANLGIFPASQQPISSLAGVSAHGRLRVDKFKLGTLQLEQFESDAEVVGRTFTVRNAKANFFSGKLTGTFDAHLLPDPSYEFNGRFDRVDLAELARAVPTINDRIAGVASGMLSLSTHGVGRETLIASIGGMGTLTARNAELRKLASAAPAKDAVQIPLPVPFPSRFEMARGSFSIAKQSIELKDFSLENGPARFQVDGRIAFSHALNIAFRPVAPSAEMPAEPAPVEFQLTGTIEAPTLAVIGQTTKIVARNGIRGN